MTKRCYGRDGRSDVRLIESRYAPVAQLDRVLGYEPRGREFESLQARHYLNNIMQLRAFPIRAVTSRKDLAFSSLLAPLQQGHLLPGRGAAEG